MFISRKKKKENLINYKAEFLHLRKDDFDEYKERIIDILYRFVTEKNLDVDVLYNSDFLYRGVNNNNIIGSGLKFSEKSIEQIEYLLFAIPDPENTELLELVIKDTYYSYDMLTKVVYPNYDKLEYIRDMVELKGFTDEREILYILENKILLPIYYYHKEYDYRKLYSLVSDYFGNFKEYYYYLNETALESLITYFVNKRCGIEGIKLILEKCSKLGYYNMQNQLIPSFIKAGYTYEELLDNLPKVVKTRRFFKSV